jgi:hypothetical protein
MRRIIAVAAAILGIPLSLGAQVIRGVVTERVSGQPLAGVLITAASIPDSITPGGIRHTLTNAGGEFSLSVRAGTVVLSAKRIGVARFTGRPISLTVGETRRLDVMLDAFRSTLPEVTVTWMSLCIPRQDQARMIVALWDEARTALLASNVTQQQRLLSGWLSRHARTLDPRTLRILEGRQSVAEGVFDRPMRSRSGDALKRDGYWHAEDGDTLVFHAPDADALLSDAFRTGHCFELANGRGAQRGMMGISFRPRPGGPRGAITGTVWLDGATLELRFVEFRYANLFTIPSTTNLGGEVHFQRLDSGAWMVRRWFVRMPQFPEAIPMALARTGYVGRPQPEVHRIIEEGGGLYTTGLRTWEAPGTIVGTVLDSTGRRPMAGAVVGLSGTPLSAITDERGGFRFDSIPPGAYTLMASDTDYAELGLIAADEALTLTAGQTLRPRLRAASTRDILRALCPVPVDSTRGVVRVLATHADSGGIVPRLRVWLRWPDTDTRLTTVDSALFVLLSHALTPVMNQFVEIKKGKGPVPSTQWWPGWRLQGIEAMTDDNGAVTFCGVPAGVPLELVILLPDDDPSRRETARFVRITSFEVDIGGVVGRTVSVRPPR